MMPQRAFGIFVAIGLIAFALAYGPPAAAKTTDESDVFWVHTESGWGIQFVQNDNAIFATLYVYGPDGQGSLTWNGTLYKPTGPWFGAMTFDPNTVTRTPVGSMSLSAPFINQQTLIYSVDGIQVTKTIERFLIAYENYGGAFVGVMSQQGSGLTCNAAKNTNATPANVQITQNTPAMTVIVTSNLDTCTFTGSYTQTGRFGHLGATIRAAAVTLAPLTLSR